MNAAEKAYLLYAVTDRTWLGARPLACQIEAALKGGVTMLQLREKNLDDKAFLEEAKRIQELCRHYQVPFIINDNIDVAIACGADGIHVGQSDLAAKHARIRIGPHKIVGVSVQTVKQALDAERDSADYLGVGAVFPTATKQDADAVTYDTLKSICAAVSIPVVAIGGINRHNILNLKGSGIHGVAVISALFAEINIKEAAIELLSLAKKTVYT